MKKEFLGMLIAVMILGSITGCEKSDANSSVTQEEELDTAETTAETTDECDTAESDLDNVPLVIEIVHVTELTEQQYIDNCQITSCLETAFIGAAMDPAIATMENDPTYPDFSMKYSYELNGLKRTDGAFARGFLDLISYNGEPIVFYTDRPDDFEVYINIVDGNSVELSDNKIEKDAIQEEMQIDSLFNEGQIEQICELNSCEKEDVEAWFIEYGNMWAGDERVKENPLYLPALFGNEVTDNNKIRCTPWGHYMFRASQVSQVLDTEFTDGKEEVNGKSKESYEEERISLVNLTVIESLKIHYLDFVVDTLPSYNIKHFLNDAKNTEAELEYYDSFLQFRNQYLKEHPEEVIFE